MEKLKTQKGITLIALIITIIVMLILVGVSVTVALDGGLFRTAENAADRTENERDIELERAEGKVEIGELKYNSIEEYVNRKQVSISPKKSTYTVGEEVTIGEEHFYVIADTTEKITLLAKYNLNRAGTEQINASYRETWCEFSSDKYWSSATNLNQHSIPEGVRSVITTAREYGNKFGKDVLGRLMIYKEFNELKTKHSGIIYGTSINAVDGYLLYWMGQTDGSEDSVDVIHGGDGNYGCSSWYDSYGWGCRPVIEISKINIF